MRRPLTVAVQLECRQRVARRFNADEVHAGQKKWALVRAPKITKGGG
jgi:thiamine monophosphate synthase